MIHDGDLGDDEKLAIQVVENALREDLRPVEQARASRSLMDARSWSTRELAAELHVAQTSVVRGAGAARAAGGRPGQRRAGRAGPVGCRRGRSAARRRASGAGRSGRRRRGSVARRGCRAVKAVRARRPAPAARPDPFELDLGDGTVVIVKWKKANRTTAVESVRKALREAQEREGGSEVDAA